MRSEDDYRPPSTTVDVVPIRPRVHTHTSQHVFRLGASVLPGLRQANRRRHLLLRILPPGGLREDIAINAQLCRELSGIEQLPARLDPVQAANNDRHQVLPVPSVRLRPRPAEHSQGIDSEPDALAVGIPRQSLLDAEQLVRGTGRRAAVREGREGAPSIRPLVRIRPPPTQALGLKPATDGLGATSSSTFLRHTLLSSSDYTPHSIELRIRP